MLTVGVKCSKGVGAGRGGAAEHTDNYLVGAGRRLRWREAFREHVEVADGAGTLLAVCDGFGVKGDVAATSAARVMAKIFQPSVPKDPPQALLKFVHQAHEGLHEAAAKKGRVRMGTSLTLAWAVEGKVHWVQVGHSRLYLLSDDRLAKLTPDHTRREFALRDGLGMPSDPDMLAQCFLYGSRGLGDDTRLRLEPGLDVGTEYLQPGDQLLLCTDGLWRFVSDDTIVRILRTVQDPELAAAALVEQAIQDGSVDNITAVVSHVHKVPVRTLGGIERKDSHTFS